MPYLNLNSFKGKSIISIHDLKKEEIEFILDVAEEFEKNKYPSILSGKIMAYLFFEPSTRTRDSFITACQKLGGGVVGFSNVSTSSVAKGESLKDTVIMYGKYADVIVIRHRLEGSARLVSETVNIPVINGGDGANQHPTQTLLDLYSIKKTQGKIEGLNVALVGDLKYGRTVHSLAAALSLYNCNLYFVSPESLKMPDDILKNFKNANYSIHTKIEEVIDKVDILYMTRIQAERFPDKTDYEKVKNVYKLKKDMLFEVKHNLKILHPLPRVNEISPEIDETPYAYYFEQAANGVPVRQALLALTLGVLK